MRFFSLFLLTLPVYAADLVTHAPRDGKAAFTFDQTAWNQDEATGQSHRHRLQHGHGLRP